MTLTWPARAEDGDMLSLFEETGSFTATVCLTPGKTKQLNLVHSLQSGPDDNPNPRPYSSGHEAFSLCASPATTPSMAMDLSHACRLTPEEKNRRQDQSLRFYCGSPDHISKGCPNKFSKANLANASIDETSGTETITVKVQSRKISGRKYAIGQECVYCRTKN
ncbi:hypothetical protein EDD21DRAFT_355891 [Dissophora ornata]|nr:hypothetical protein EDD21DRAFT_355891 [Dissophora ornata]